MNIFRKKGPYSAEKCNEIVLLVQNVYDFVELEYIKLPKEIESIINTNIKKIYKILREEEIIYSFNKIFEDLRYFFPPNENSVFHVLISIIRDITRNYDKNKITFEILIKKIYNCFNKINKRKRVLYKIFIPINYQNFNTLATGNLGYIANLKIIGKNEDRVFHTLSLRELDFFDNQYREQLLQYTQNLTQAGDPFDINHIDPRVRTLNNNDTSNFLYGEIYARNKHYPIKKMIEIAHINLGIWTYCKHKFQDSKLHPLNDLIHKINDFNTPYAILIKNEELTFIQFYSYNNSLDHAYEFINQKDIGEINSIIDIINRIENQPFKKYVLKIFRWYFEAIKDTDMAKSFQKFWTILEFALNKQLKQTHFSMLRTLESTLKENYDLNEYYRNEFKRRSIFMPSDDLDEDVRDMLLQRINSLLEEGFENFQSDFMDNIYQLNEKRNKLIHKSININEKDRFFVKRLVDFVIEIILNSTESCNNLSDVDKYFATTKKKFFPINNS